MPRTDIALIRRIDLLAALGLLTRLPVRLDTGLAMARGARTAWAYPLAGVVIGVILAIAAAVLNTIGLPSAVGAGLVLALSVIVTGAMHEDGLADSADGLWGGWDRARRLAIMKDSHIGVYGVCAVVLSLLLRWTALVVIISMGAHWMALIAAAALSRAAMVAVMAGLPNARDGGLSRSVGRPPSPTLWFALGIGAAVAVLMGYPMAIITAGLATGLCMAVAQAKIGGQTGDILGATQQIVEITVLITIVGHIG